MRMNKNKVGINKKINFGEIKKVKKMNRVFGGKRVKTWFSLIGLILLSLVIVFAYPLDSPTEINTHISQNRTENK